MAVASGSYHVYYEILGLSPGATTDQIKRAYRAMAKQYHPDLNKAADAQERFIEVNEAYEFLLRLQKAPSAAAGSRRRRYYRQPAADDLFREWMSRERQKARERAARAARKRYEEFMRSPIYRTSQIVSAAYDYIIFAVGILMIVGSVTGMIFEIRRSNGAGIPSDEHIDFITTHIASTLILSFIGIIFIIFALFNIRERIETRREKKRRKRKK